MIKDYNDQYNHIMNSINANNLSSDKELELLKEAKNIILTNNRGRKVIKKICGQKYYVSKKNVYKLIKVCQLIQNKENAINNIDKDKWYTEIVPNKSNDNYNIKTFYQLLNKLLQKESIIKQSPVLTSQYNELKYQLMNKSISIKDKNKLINTFLKDNIIAFNFISGKNNPQREINESVIDMRVEDLRGYENLKEMQIEPKPKRKKFKTHKLFKRIVAGFSAFLMIGICSIVSRGNTNEVSIEKETQSKSHSIDTTKPVKKTHKTKIEKITKKTNKTYNTNNKTKTSKSHKSIIVSKTNKESNNNKETIKNKKKTNIKFNKSIKLGTKFKLKKDSLIYSNVSNANNKYNGKKAFYDNNITRKCVGLSIEYNKKIITFIEISDDNYKVYGLDNIYLSSKEANKEITNLLKQGGKVKSILSQNNNNYEGYYTSDNVKVLVK